MDESEIRNVMEQLMENEVLVSIPEAAGFWGDLEAINYFTIVKEKMMANDRPLSMTKPGDMGLKTFVYGETVKMKSNPQYLEAFVRMSQQFGRVQDIFALHY